MSATVIGILSDSGGDLGAFEAAYGLLQAKGATRYFFLGGQFADLDGWVVSHRDQARGGWQQDPSSLRDMFLRVPERGSPEYARPEVSTKVVDMLGDQLCCLVHDKNDLDRDDLLNASFFIHGKEPAPKVVQIGPRCFITPGSLAGASSPSCGLLEILDKERLLRFSAFTLAGQQLLDVQELSLDRRTKLSVK